MHHSKRTDISNGYIMKLYRRAENVSEEAIIDDSMFMTWMNFDCMDVIKVYDFQEYHNLVDVSDNPPREIYASWQKLFLYRLKRKNRQYQDWESEELLQPADSLGEFPLITLSMLNIRRNPNVSNRTENMEWYEEKMQHFLAEHMADVDDIKGEIYGSLAVHDYVLALRGNDYRKMDAILNIFKQKMWEEGITFNKVYTIAGIDRKHLSAWNTDGLKTSIRLSCTSDIGIEQLKDSAELKKAFNGYKVYSILGKYDFDIVGEITSPEKFVALFLKGGILSAFEKSIHKSNTRFFNADGRYCSELESVQEQDVKPPNRGAKRIDSEKNSELWEYFYERYSKIKGLPPSITEALSRLVLRAFQVIVTTNHSGMADDLKEKLYDFLDFIYIHQNDYRGYGIQQDRVQDVYASMINTFNLMLDNRVSVGMSDFEAPQNVLRYSGASMKVLLAYSSYVDELIKILKHNKNNENKAAGKETLLKYIVLVTVDPTARICATVSLSYSEYYRFIHISIPIDLMFEMGNVLPWVTHEAGHFIRAGWNREERNNAYFSSVARGAINELMPFATLQLSQNLDRNLVAGTGIPLEGGEKFSSYCKYVTQYFQMVIYRFATDYSREFRIPHNRARDLLENVIDIADGLKRIYEEAIADMFMLQVLGIENLSDYLNIQEAYFRRLCMNVEHLPQENVSRIMAVSVVLEKLPSDKYEKITEFFAAVYSNCPDNNVRPIIKQLKEFRNYYLLEPLVVFLSQHVRRGLQELLNESELIKCLNKIKGSYWRLKKGEFEEYLHFVLQKN